MTKTENNKPIALFSIALIALAFSLAGIILPTGTEDTVKLETGTYVGAGNSSIAITGVGFQPTVVMVYRHSNVYDDFAVKTDQDGTYCKFMSNAVSAGQWRWGEDHIISLDPDGFTVGDGTPLAENIFNINGIPYTYICWG